MVSKGEASSDGSDSEITLRSAWAISLGRRGREQRYCTVCRQRDARTRARALPCQFLHPYHLIKARPCRSAPERTPLPLSFNTLLVFPRHAVSCGALFLGVNTCMFDILYRLIPLFLNGCRSAVASNKMKHDTKSNPVQNTFETVHNDTCLVCTHSFFRDFDLVSRSILIQTTRY